MHIVYFSTLILESILCIKRVSFVTGVGRWLGLIGGGGGGGGGDNNNPYIYIYIKLLLYMHTCTISLTFTSLQTYFTSFHLNPATVPSPP